MTNEVIKVSIVTVSYNSGKTIKRTMESVLNQTYSNIEYILIDGASIDNTLSVIRSFDSSSYLLVSERDEGISDAFNKAIEMASGDLIAFLNADDYYTENDVVSKIVKNYVDSNTVLCGSLCLVSENQDIIKILHSNPSKLKKGMYIMHPTCFVPLELIRKVGLFSKNIKIAMDYEYFVRLMSAKANFKVLPIVITNMQVGGASYNYKVMACEELQIKNNYFGRKISNYQHFVLTMIIHFLRQKAKLVMVFLARFF